MRRFLALLGLAALFAAPAAAQTPKQPYWVGKTFPSIRVPKEHWVNVPKPPSRTELRGKVLWVQFTFLG